MVVVACGYHSKQIPLKDVTGTLISLAKSNTVRNQNDPSAFGATHKLTQPEQVEVNYNCQLMQAQSRKPITGLYGIGQGYSLATSDMTVQAELRQGAKADSVGLYIKQIGNKILGQLLPDSEIRMAAPPAPEAERPAASSFSAQHVQTTPLPHSSNMILKDLVPGGASPVHPQHARGATDLIRPDPLHDTSTAKNPASRAHVQPLASAPVTQVQAFGI